MKLVCALAFAIGCSSPAVSRQSQADAGEQPHADAADHPSNDAAVQRDSAPQVKRVFATHTLYGGAFGGVSQGDQLCQNAATTAQLGGTWKAWLSVGMTNATDRLTDVGAWYLVDGVTLVFANKQALTEAPLVAIDVDEDGDQIQQASPFNIEGAWTGTEQDGQSGEDDDTIGQEANCAEWIGTVGGTAIIGNIMDASTWTDVGDTDLALCDEEQEHLYCFEQ
jgi:hypothetical protein